MNLPNCFISIFLRIIIFGLALFPWSHLHAQLNSKYLTQYTEQDGVPGSQVNAILPDRLGYIWIGTINGLARYDGYEFKRFYNNPNDSSSIKGLIVWSLFEDHKGQILIGSSPEFLNVYNQVTKTFKQYDYKHLIAHPANVEVGIQSMSEDKKGRIYLGISTYYGNPIDLGLLYIDEKDNKVKKFEVGNQELKNVYSITTDNDGNMWLLSYSGLFKIDVNRKLIPIHAFDKVKLIDTADYPTYLKCDKEGLLWLITNKSKLLELNLRDSTFHVYSPEGTFPNTFLNSRLVFDKKENIWMGSSKGLLSFDRKLMQFKSFKGESLSQLEHSPIQDLHFDSFGSLWLGTIDKGALKYEERTVFRLYSFNKNEKNSLTQGWANAIYETHDGNIWVATSGPPLTAGLNILNPRTNSVTSLTYRSILPGINWFGAFYESSPGELILNTNLGNYQFSTQSHRVKKVDLPGIPGNLQVNQFYTDKNNSLWACTMGGLYKKNKPTDTFKKYDLSTVPGGDAGSNEITHVFESRKHGLWMTTNNGLFLYNYTTDKIERLGFDKKAGDIFITQDINSFYEDSSGMAWVGTWQGGLSMYNPETKKIKTFTRNDGLPSMSIQGILGDENNHVLWLSTFDGLSRFDLNSKQFNNFSIADGIQSQLFADGAFLKTSQGLFVFGGSNGITVFSADDVQKNSVPPKVFLTDLKLFDKSVIPGVNSILKQPLYDTKEIVLPYDQNNISLEFIAIHYSNPSKNKYAYKLENYDNDWREVANQHAAFYPKLSPGEYLFKVKAANNNGVWNEEGASLKIIVRPPWWRTTLAYIMYLLLLIAGGLLLDRYLRSRVVKKERERNRLRELEQAKEIEKAYYKLEETHQTLKATQSQLIQSEKMASLGELTAGIAHEIQNPLNFVNNFSEVNKELLLEMKDEIDKGNLAEVKTIAGNIIENEEKINQHGKRADVIVKGMLQHSRNSTGAKELTDINELADEYLRLAYHGYRAKDKLFNATLKTDYDESIGKISIIPQEIGRVILNLISNAFYAVDEKRKHHPENYEPTISVSTEKHNARPDDPVGRGRVELRIGDNGNGIPQKTFDKIFQPFFTTKPAGQGTGLGLSLSYDIIKAHGGEIKAETKAGEGTEFIVELPVG
jgi:signal transduction histidine kinase/ligand-binding sensor domain-containing protein